MLGFSRRMERTCLMSTAPTKGTIVVRTRALRNVPQCPGIPTKMLAFILRTAKPVEEGQRTQGPARPVSVPANPLLGFWLVLLPCS